MKVYLSRPLLKGWALQIEGRESETKVFHANVQREIANKSTIGLLSPFFQSVNPTYIMVEFWAGDFNEITEACATFCHTYKYKFEIKEA